MVSTGWTIFNLSHLGLEHVNSILLRHRVIAVVGTMVERCRNYRNLNYRMIQYRRTKDRFGMFNMCYAMCV
eukprot:scaffold130285_cov35-Attheya_sp.AAC.3